MADRAPRRPPRLLELDILEVEAGAVEQGGSTSGAQFRTVTVLEGRRSADCLETAVEGGTARYVVIESLGKGGMGEVLRAYDPKLRREVALKRLHAERYDEDSQARLVREAQAMARLSHPNVVAVHDVEVDGATVVVAMEYVPGPTLKDWLAHAGDDPRPWRLVVEVFCRAARGLAAAHASGLVHRDFKPANVLLTGENDRPDQVKVTDFGIAKEIDGDGHGGSVDMRTLAIVPALETMGGSTLTATGSILGTPWYMAPEQYCGANVDAKADQFALCVALWQALTGEPPFVGADILQCKLQGPRPWPRTTLVPAGVVAAIRRGLAADPAQRWPTVDALVEALAASAADGRHSGRRVAAAAVGLCVGGIGLWGALSSNAALCTGAASELAEVWNDERREAVRAALLATDAAYAGDTAQRVHGILEDYGRAWAEGHTQACEATSVRGEQSPAIMDLRMGCLRRAKMELRAAVELLASADQVVLQKANDVVRGLPDPARCSDAKVLARDDAEPHDPAVVAHVQRLREQLAETRALLRAGKSADALARIEVLLAGDRSAGYEVVQPELQLAHGKALTSLGRYEQAAAALKDGISQSLRHGSNGRVAASMAAELTSVLGGSLQQFEWAHWTADFGLALAAKLEDAEVESELRSSLGSTLNNEGKYADAEQQHRLALDLRRTVLGASHPDVAVSHCELGIALRNQGKDVEAEQQHRIALELKQRALGPEHPEIAASLGNLGNALWSQGKYGEAEAQQREALELLQNAFGHEHPYVATSHNNLGAVLHNEGKYVEAEEQHRIALAVRQKVLGREHPDVGMSHHNLGMALIKLERFAEAEQELRAALELCRKAFGDGHPHVGMTHNSMGQVLVAQMRSSEAMAHYEHAMAIRRATNAPVGQTAQTAFALAKILWENEPERARRLAEEARDGYRSAGQAHERSLRSVERWLAQHRV